MSFIIDPANPPLARPGAYLIRHVASGKCYVGISDNVSRRFLEHGRGNSPKTLKLAISEQGSSKFEFRPLFYSLNGTTDLPETEAGLIVNYDCLVPSGYNVISVQGRVGPYGPKFAALVKAAMESTEIRQKMSDSIRATMATPAYQSKQSAAVRLALSSPQAKANKSAAAKAAHARPETKAKHSAAVKAVRSTAASRAKSSASLKIAFARPEMKAKRSAAQKLSKAGGFWVTNGQADRYLSAGLSIPMGWRKGRTRGCGRSA